MPEHTAASALHILRAGAAERPAILLIHALGASGSTWAPQLTALGLDRHLLVPDLPGHGRSAPAGKVEEYRVEHLATRLLGRLDALGIERAHVIGHAFGGVIALAFALLAPERLGALVLEDTSPEPLPAALRSQIRRTLAESGQPDAGVGAGATVLATSTPDGGPDSSIPAAALWGALEFEGYVERLEAIEAPTLVIVGEQDSGANQRGAELLHGLIPYSRLVRLPEAGHTPHEEVPDAFAAELLGFLHEVESTG